MIFDPRAEALRLLARDCATDLVLNYPGRLVVLRTLPRMASPSVWYSIMPPWPGRWRLFKVYESEAPTRPDLHRDYRVELYPVMLWHRRPGLVAFPNEAADERRLLDMLFAWELAAIEEMLRPSSVVSLRTRSTS